MELSNISTTELVSELKNRPGIEVHYADPYKDQNVSVNGPAIILVITD